MLQMFDGGLYIVLAMLAVIAITVLLRKNQSGRDGKPLPPCFPSLPIVGSLPYVAGGLEVLPELFMNTAEKLGPVFSFYAGPRQVKLSLCENVLGRFTANPAFTEPDAS